MNVHFFFRTIPEKSLVLLEDIDAAFHDRKPTRDINHITFSGFLNALDGVSAGKYNSLTLVSSMLFTLQRMLLPLHVKQRIFEG